MTALTAAIGSAEYRARRVKFRITGCLIFIPIVDPSARLLGDADHVVVELPRLVEHPVEERLLWLLTSVVLFSSQ